MTLIEAIDAARWNSKLLHSARGVYARADGGFGTFVPMVGTVSIEEERWPVVMIYKGEPPLPMNEAARHLLWAAGLGPQPADDEDGSD